MPKITDFLHLIVPLYIPMAITSLLVGATSTINALPDWRFWLAALSLACVVGAFNAFNAIADREIDRINKAERPVPSKKISEKQALFFAMFLYFIALASGFLINITFFGIIFVAVILTTLYSYPGIELKKKFFLGTLTVTFFYAVLCTLSGWALYPDKPIPVPIIFFLLFIGFSMAITKDFMDVVGDSYNQAHTFPVRLGNSQSAAIVFIFLVFSFLFLIFLISQGILPTKYYALLILSPMMLLNISSLKKKGNSSEALFNRNILLIIVLEILIVVLAII